MLCQGKSRFSCYVIRALNSSAKVCASHYDVLGVTPKATQGDIKTAYYKLSKIYHPDKSNNEESSRKFRAITEAYEILGNIKLKKMYDKGLLVGKENTSRVDYHPDPEPTDPELKFYKSRMTHNITRPNDGRTPIYDFDAWSKNHYENLFKKSQYDKENIRKRNENLENLKRSTNEETFLYVIMALGVLFMMLLVTGKTDYDVIQVKKNNSNVQVTETEVKKVDRKDS